MEQAERTAKAMARLPILHQRVDELVTERVAFAHEHAGSVAQCKTGCAWCCYHLVPATMPEVLAALLEALRTGHKKLVTRLNKVRKDFNAFTRVGWDNDRWVRQRRACLFLTEGNRCAAYNARPLACRAYVAFSNPDLCRDGKPIDGSDALTMIEERVGDDLAEVSRELGTTHKQAPIPALLPYAMKLLVGEDEGDDRVAEG